MKKYLSVNVIETSGHMPGHISIYIESMKTLISGDMLILENGVLGLDYIENNLSCDIDYYVAAKIMNCSEWEFRRIFSFLAQIPLSEYAISYGRNRY